MVGLISTFRHELVSTVLVSAFIGILMWPFKRVVAAYRETKTKLEEISTELAVQRVNCLTTLQDQGEAQVKLLTEAVGTLRDMHSDTRVLLDRLERK